MSKHPEHSRNFWREVYLARLRDGASWTQAAVGADSAVEAEAIAFASPPLANGAQAGAVALASTCAPALLEALAEINRRSDAVMGRAQAAEAEVERLKQERREADENLETQVRRATKAEALLGEALAVLRQLPRIMRDRSVAQVEEDGSKVLARASQEGFAHGE
ncbi:MAG TPA: hypothetical protein VFP50_15505 [Anaeromyxobacteraceae bacterium]|nr:hypothetical protein [Anaeromyxobacteraceae bacterium]